MDPVIQCMTPKKERTWSIPVLGIILLSAGILFYRTGFKAPSNEAAPAVDIRPSGGAGLVDAAATGAPDFRLDVRSVTQIQVENETGCELRCEKRELSMAIRDLYQGDSSRSPESLGFPLFDGKSVRLGSLRHQSMGADQGVVFAKADGEPEGGHVLLSYVGTALAGMIHLPSRGEFYEIRTAPDGKSHLLTQLDPNKMPVCGGCNQHHAN